MSFNPIHRSSPIEKASSSSLESSNSSILMAAEHTASTPSKLQKQNLSTLNCFLSNDYNAENNRFNGIIDSIIKNRRDEHASSFGYKYLKDTMDNTESNVVWAACLIPRLIIAPIYTFGRCSGILYLVNPVNWLRGILGSIAVHAVSISPEARKEQAIRTFVEGTEEKTAWHENSFEHYRQVYDKNKQYKDGVLGEVENISSGAYYVDRDDAGRTILVDLPDIFNGDEAGKEQLCAEIRAIQERILQDLPHAASTSWFKKLDAKLVKLQKMECAF